MPARITDKQVETIKAAYAETGSITQAARQAGVSLSTAHVYVRSNDSFEDVRREKRLDIIEEIARVRQLYIEHLAKPEVMATATAKDAATVFGILTDKHQLLTGEATERKEHLDPDAARERRRRRIEEMAERRRREAPTEN